jgi:predicted P-loop ATPase
MTAFDEQVLAEIGPLREAGFAIHWLHPKSKRPIGEDWSTKPVATLEQLRRRHSPGVNVGVRLGEVSQLVDGSYLHAIDLDIRDPAYADEARAKLDELFPAIADSVPSVISGSGGPSRHYYFACEKAFPSKKLARSETFKMVYDEKLGREVKKRDWEIELFGTGKQVAMPPSIHPDTGKPYLWERAVDLDELMLGLFPRIPAARLEELGMLDNAASADSLDLKPPLGLTEDEAQAILDDLPIEEYCEDRDGWLTVGMALHHEFGGDEIGYDIWKEFSEQSAKFDEKDQRVVWNSFRQKPNSVRMATLKAVANQVRMFQAFDDIDDDEPGADEDEDEEEADDDIDALIGGPSTGNDFESVLAAGAEAGLGWISLMEVNEEGAFRPTLHNVKLIVRNDPRFVGLAQINEFTQETVQRISPGYKEPRRKNQAKPVVQLEGRIWDVADPLNGSLWSDDRDFAMRALIEAPRTQGGYGIKVSDRDLKAAIVIAANDHAFHPVREYLNGLKWDGTRRVERLFVDYLAAEPNPYTLDIARLMMTAAVTRIFEPGHKFDFAVILEGLQGKRKSTFIEILGRKWFAELDGDFHDPKMMIELMQGAWILELPELTGFQRSDVRAIKAFISRKKDRARLAYARRAGEFPRQCIFIGSTNDREYLKDDTGGRRFWPMPCHVAEIDTAKLERNVDQLWAEAVLFYRQMRAAQPVGTLPLHLRDDESRAIAAGLQESRRMETSDDGMAGVIAAWLAAPINDGGFDDLDKDQKPRYRDKVCLPQIWVECLRGDLRSYTAANQQAIARAMSKAAIASSWQQASPVVHGAYGRQRTYVRVTPLEEADLIG